MSVLAFYFDAERCTGCKTCMLACKDYKDLPIGLAYRKVYEVTYGACELTHEGYINNSTVSYNVSLSCNHCKKPACTKVCPTHAMHKDEESGIVLVDHQRCIGCGYCHMACPYNVPKVDEELGQSRKCDACAERVVTGEKPVCVEACPARALDFGDIEKLSLKGKEANIAPLPDPSYTNPCLYIKSSPDALPSRAAQGVVANPLEVL